MAKAKTKKRQSKAQSAMMDEQCEKKTRRYQSRN